jgi:hypothetical protein
LGLLHILLPPSSKRRRFANSERLVIVRNVRRRVEAGESISGACRALYIIPKQYKEWSMILRAMMRQLKGKEYS